MALLHAHPNGAITLLLMFLLSCGARKASAMHAKWEETDLVDRVWRIPTSKSKSNR